MRRPRCSALHLTRDFAPGLTLRANVESGEHDSNKHRGLVGSLQRAIREYEDRIAALLRDMSLRR